MIYFLQNEAGHIKIGISRNFKARYQTLQREHGNLKALGFLRGKWDREKALHNRFQDSWLHGEWFEPSKDLLDFILHESQETPPENELKVYFALREMMEAKSKRLIDVHRGTGISYSRLHAFYNSGVSRIGKDTLNSLCEYFECEPGDLIKRRR